MRSLFFPRNKLYGYLIGQANNPAAKHAGFVVAQRHIALLNAILVVTGCGMHYGAILGNIELIHFTVALVYHNGLRFAKGYPFIYIAADINDDFAFVSRNIGKSG